MAADNRVELLKGYLRRLGEGEAIETVRADFVEAFQCVDASEIMKAEQEMIREGTPITEVQKLCDIHSALFHGVTRQEKLANAQKATGQACKVQKAGTIQPDFSHKKERTALLAERKGHPLQTLTEENRQLDKLLVCARRQLETGENMTEVLGRLRELSVHYAKKGDLLYPHLSVQYGVSGPSNVMWTVDDEIRDELMALSRSIAYDEQWKKRMESVLTRIDEMIYKEDNILFPNCAVYFTEEEWMEIYRDAKDYGSCLGVVSQIWEEAEERIRKEPSFYEGEIRMPGGHMTVAQLTALLNTIPMEITFIDDNNVNRFFNEGSKVFKRPGMAIDREVFSCHPPKIEPMVRKIIEDFRNHKKDTVPVWMEKGGRSMLVTYMAVRDHAGKYLGTVECVQDMEFAKEHFNG